VLISIFIEMWINFINVAFSQYLDDFYYAVVVLSVNRK